MTGPHHQQPSWLRVGHGNDQRSIAYLNQPGDAPGIFWVTGFKSQMISVKASALADWTRRRCLAYTRFDYSGHGQSGGNFEDGTLSQWLEETVAVFEQVTTGPQIVVGSSMGGYLALLLARTLSDRQRARLAGLVLIAPSWNMTELMWSKATPAALRAIENDGVWYRPSQYDDAPYPITRRLLEDGRKHLFKETPWAPGCAVEIIHGRLDPDVPFERSERLLTWLKGPAVNLTEVVDGEHRLSRDSDLELLYQRIEALI